jgi:hypothetical protein
VFGYLDHAISTLARTLDPTGGEADDDLTAEAVASATSAGAKVQAKTMKQATSGQLASDAATAASTAKTVVIPGLGTVTMHEYGGSEEEPPESIAEAEKRRKEDTDRSALFARGPAPEAEAVPDANESGAGDAGASPPPPVLPEDDDAAIDLL